MIQTSSPLRDDDARSGEVLGPKTDKPDPDKTNLIALISNYTDRPDLLLAEIEKHDPGFTKRMDAASESRATRTETARFFFGKRQAYSALCLSLIAALAVLFVLYVLVSSGQASFWTLLGIGVMYAITQGGALGFNKLIDSISVLAGRQRPPDQQG